MEVKETKKKSESSGQKPVKTIRRGAIAAHIWQRQAQTGFTYYDFSISRSWKSSAAGREGYSQNFFAENEEALIEVLRETANEIRKLSPAESQSAQAA